MPQFGYLSEIVSPSVAITPTAGAAGVTELFGQALDMDGYEGALVVVALGDIGASAVADIGMEQAAEPTFATPELVAGTLASPAATDDGKLVLIDIRHARRRYLRVRVARLNAPTTLSGLYVRYGSRTHPFAPHGDILSLKTLFSPPVAS